MIKLFIIIFLLVATVVFASAKGKLGPLSKPTGINKINPINELKEDLAKEPWKFIVVIVSAFMIADFFSGFLVQIWMQLFNKRFRIGVFNSFLYGVSDGILITLILFVGIMYVYYRIYRAVRKNYVKNYDDNYLISEKETYGGAHFQTEEEMKDDFTFFDTLEATEGEILGITKYKKYCVFNYPLGLNHNRFYTGSPGSGKTASIVKTTIYQNMKAGVSMLCTDTKGAVFRQTSRLARKMGYEVKALMIKPQWFKNSNGFNMFTTLTDDEELDSKADIYANTIIQTTKGVKEIEDYWSKNEFNLLKAIIMYIATDKTYISQRKNNLAEVYNFISSHNAKSLAGVFTNISPSSPIRHCYNIFANCKEDNQGQIINGLSIRLTKLSNIYIQQMLSNDEIDFTAPMKRKCIYYIITADNDTTYKFISALFFQVIIRCMSDYSDSLTEEEKEKQLSVDIIADELKAFGGIPNLPDLIATLRDRKIFLQLILQNKSQLEELYGPTGASTILECCCVKGLLATNDLDTAQYFSDLTGTQTVLAESVRYQENATDIVHAHDQVTKSIGEGQRNLMLASEIMNGKLKREEILYIISGMPPLRLSKCFAEKKKEGPIHPYEKEARRLGWCRCEDHIPDWKKEFDRKLQEEAEAGAAYRKQEQPKEQENVTKATARNQEQPIKQSVNKVVDSTKNSKKNTQYEKQSATDKYFSLNKFAEDDGETEKETEPSLNTF